MTDMQVKVNKRKWPKFRNYDLNHNIMRWAGTEWCGNDCPPGDFQSLRIPYEDDPGEYRVYNIKNDGYELWIGTMNKWAWHMSRKEAHQVAKFIIWDWWIKAEWFGFRRWLYYKALHRAVEGYRKGYRKASEQ